MTLDPHHKKHKYKMKRIELLTFSSFLPSKKQIVMKKKISEMMADGWIFEKSTSVKFWTSIHHLGGALHLHFTKG